MSGDSRVRRRLRQVAGIAAILLAVPVLGGCSRPVAVDPPATDADTVHTCADFTAALPSSMSTAGQRRDVRPDSELTAAYGDPPVTIRCGVSRPATLEATSTLVTVDGIDWFPEQLSAGWRMTTTGRAANVEIAVPASQGPAPSVAADLTAVIESTIPTVRG